MRHSELDWLRVILILAVFLHHVFMPFNGDEWHIMNAESSKLLDDIMVYFEQIRLPALFFIAGAGSLLLLNKMGAKGFIHNKFNRLFLPLLVGVFLVVPPQNYFENPAGYSSVLQVYAASNLNYQVNHLWFIEYLIVFMVLAVVVHLAIPLFSSTRLAAWVERLALSRHGLFLLVLVPLIGRSGSVFISDFYGVADFSKPVFYLLFFLAGMLFIAHDGLWRAIRTHRSTNLKWLVGCTLLFYAYYFSPDLSPYLSLTTRWQIWWLVCTLVSWAALLTIFGYARVWLTSSPGWLVSTNELIYPFYIFHQTVIVAIAFYIVQLDLSLSIKSLTLLLSSLSLTALICYFLIRPFNLMRYLFGLKIKSR